MQYFTKVKKIDMVFKFSRGKQIRNVTYISKKRICTTVNSHVNSKEPNNLNTLNSDNVIRTSNFPHRNVKNDSPFDTLGTLQKVTDTESSVSINDEKTDKNNIREEISYHQKPAEVIDHTCDDNGINLLNIEE